MEKLLEITMLADGALFWVGLEGYRRRLALKTEPVQSLSGYPHSKNRYSRVMGWFHIWTGEHRKHNDHWMSRFVWLARATLFAFPLIGVVFLLVP
jgi:hypothetical protein